MRRLDFTRCLLAICAVLIPLAGVLATGPAKADPWMPMNDIGLRDDIELLSDYGVIEGPVTTWPIPLAQIAPGINDAASADLPPHVRAALNRVRRILPTAYDFEHVRFGGDVAVTNKAGFLRDFGADGRDDFDMTAIVQRQWSRTFVKLQAGAQFDLDHRRWKLDGSYAAQLVGNWILFAGEIDQWWGPGWASSLILSNNARPMPRVGFMRNAPEPIDFPVLRWLGPWRLSASVGLLNGDRTDFHNPYQTNIRFSFVPARGLEIGLFHDFQMCGSGRQCGFSDWLNNLGVGGTTRINSGDPATDPGNIMTGIDIRTNWRINTVIFSLYGQIYGEDSSRRTIVQDTARQVGFSVAMPLARPGWSMRVITEFSDTAGVFNLLDGERRFNNIYTNYIYTYGYRYRDRAIGASIDNDGKLTSLMLSLNAPDGARYWLKYHHALLNVDNTGFNTASLSREAINIVEGTVEVPSEVGRAKFGLQLMDNQPNSPDRDHWAATVSGHWSFLF